MMSQVFPLGLPGQVFLVKFFWSGLSGQVFLDKAPLA
jgi:hypothetical protein